MDRLGQLRGESQPGSDSSGASSVGDPFVTADSSKYFSISDGDTSVESPTTTKSTDLISNLSPIPKNNDLSGYKISEQIEAANILSGGVDIFDDDNSNEDSLVIDDNPMQHNEEKSVSQDAEEHKHRGSESTGEETLVPSETTVQIKDAEIQNSEIILNIDGKNVNAIDTGNDLYLYRLEEEGERQGDLAAVQIVNSNQGVPTFKFLKVKWNDEGNLEVYEEIIKEIAEEEFERRKLSAKDVKKHDHIKSDKSLIKQKVEKKPDTTTPLKFGSEARKSPIGSFTPFTFHSTPIKEGVPLTKTMVDLHLQTSLHSDITKKTIEVNTDGCKSKPTELSKNDTLANNQTLPLQKESTMNPEKKSENIDLNNVKIKSSEFPQEVHSNEKELATKVEIVEQETKLSETIPEEPDAHKGTNRTNTQAKNTQELPSVSIATESLMDSILDKERAVKGSTSYMVDNKVTQNDVDKNLTKNYIQTKLPTSNEKAFSCEKNISRTQVDKEATYTKIMVKDKATQDKKDGEFKDIDDETGNTDNKCTGPLPKEIISEPLNALCLIPRNEVDKEATDTKIIVKDKATQDKKYGELKDIDDETGNTDNKGTGSLPKEIISKPINELCLISINQVDKEGTDTKIILKDKATQDKNDGEFKDIDDETGNTDNKSIGSLPKEIIPEPLNELCLISGNQVDKEATDTKIILKHKVTQDKKDGEFKDIDDETGNTDNKGTGSLPKEINSKPINELCLISINQVDKEGTDKKIILKDKATQDKKGGEFKDIDDETGNTDKKGAGSLPKEIISEPLNKLSPTSRNQVDKEATDTKIIVKDMAIQDKKDGEFKDIDDETGSNDNKGTRSLPKEIVPESLNELCLHKSDTIHERPESKIKDVETVMPDKIEMAPEAVSELILDIDENKLSSNETATNLNDNSISCLKEKTKSSVTELKNPHENSLPKELHVTSTSKLGNEIKPKSLNNNNNNNAVPFGQWTEANKQEYLNKIKDYKTSTSNNSSNQIKQTNDLNRRDFHIKMDGKFAGLSKNDASNINKIPTKTKPIVSKPEKVDPARKPESSDRSDILNFKDLIDKAVEGMLMDKPTTSEKQETEPSLKQENLKEKSTSNTLSDIELKMNELHGTPFVERPPHKLPSRFHEDRKKYDKVMTESKVSKPTNPRPSTKIPNLLPLSNTIQNKDKDDFISEEDILDYPPVTGDTDPAPITEKDFDKFARRNSVTYERQVTVKFDAKKTPSIVQTAVKKTYFNNPITAKSYKVKPQYFGKPPVAIKSTTNRETENKGYSSNIKLAYHSALTAKRQKESPITVIEDKPVKVVYMENSNEFGPYNLNVQGQDLSSKSDQKSTSDLEMLSSCDSLDDTITEPKKHLRKQDLTLVDAPDLELIEPTDLGLTTKRKRKTFDLDDHQSKRSPKNVLPRKSYLLTRKVEDLPTYTAKASLNTIDSLVMAAELLEKQPDVAKAMVETNTNRPQDFSVKRGRGRPRKNPLSGEDPNNTTLNNTTSPKNKAERERSITSVSDLSATLDSSDDGEHLENWTMGKINENIVCPICSKLFRSENVVFKHVKHCTGPSPNRSESSRTRSRGPGADKSDSSAEDSESAAKEDDDASLQTIKDMLDKKQASRKPIETKQTKIPTSLQTSHNSNNVCETCGKAFRQLSYLVSHRLIHIKEVPKETTKETKNVLSCKICNKEFRKLHHLAQHRITHRNQRNASEGNAKSSADTAKTSAATLKSSINTAKRLTDTVKASADTAETSAHTATISVDTSKILTDAVKRSVDMSKTSSGTSKSLADTTKPTTKAAVVGVDSRISKSSTEEHDKSVVIRCEQCQKTFRKLHHLAEHRETHIGISKTKAATTNIEVEKASSPPPPTCNICNKSFRKLHHLSEHKDNKCEGKKGTFAAKQLIHECPLCYMVFPNEHSLEKHTISCRRKKRQSALKQAKAGDATADQGVPSADNTVKIEENLTNPADVDPNKKTDQKDPPDPKVVTEEHNVPEPSTSNPQTRTSKRHFDDAEPHSATKVKKLDEVEDKILTIKDETKPTPVKKPTKKVEEVKPAAKPETKDSVVKFEVKEELVQHNVDTKNEAENMSKRKKDDTSVIELSDDDEDDVRYMFNPDFREREFHKVKSQKRNSLTLDRTAGKSSTKRRISLQHTSRPSRTPSTSVPDNQNAKLPKTVPSSHQDDDIKYSFPKTKRKDDKPKVTQPTLPVTRKSQPKVVKKTLPRKEPVPAHRCDCGQLFGSGALLARHATLVHTPPRRTIQRTLPPPTAQSTTTQLKTKTLKPRRTLTRK